MPSRDIIYNIVKQAIIKDGWKITDDPYTISYGERFLFIDLGGQQIKENSQGEFMGAEKENRKIAIEIKDFRSKSDISALQQAIGQYTLYKLLLNEIEPDRNIYLAITNFTYDNIFSEPIGQLVINKLPLKLIVVNLAKMEVKLWIH